MEKNVYDDLKYVEIWLTKAEATDCALRQSLKPLYAAYKTEKYRVVVFESGTENLFTSTKDLLSHAMEVEAQGKISM